MVNLKNFSISLASPQQILQWSSRYIYNILYIGIIQNSNTLNYKTGIPFEGGIFCEKIFGPIVSWTCECQKFIKAIPFVCFVCGKEVNTSRVRRFRFGSIKLNTLIFHSWYFKNNKSILPVILNLDNSLLIDLIYYKRCLSFVDNYEDFIDVDDFDLVSKYLIYINYYIYNYLCNINILESILKSKEQLLTNKIKHIADSLILKINYLQLFYFNKLQLAWLLLTMFPVLPADLRPINKIDLNTYIISSINRFYLDIIMHNMKLEYYMDNRLKFPISFEINSKVFLQQAVDNILQKTSQSEDTKYPNFLLKSLIGKYNLFRQNILGKRLDFSGRSVIISGPDLTFARIGIPLNIGIGLFLPMVKCILNQSPSLKYIIQFLSIKSTLIVFKRILTRLFRSQMLLVNRAPTLHRVNIQAFKPFLIEGSAIRLYPLVCKSFNADFDGDQMSIFLNLTHSSLLESKYVINTDKNIFSLKYDNYLYKMNQLISLGLFNILNVSCKYTKNSLLYFGSLDFVLDLFFCNLLNITTLIWIRIYYFDRYLRKYFILTTVSRSLINKYIYA